MFATCFRIQARFVLTAARTHISAAQLAPRVLRTSYAPSLLAARLLSSSRPLYNTDDTGFTSRPEAPPSDTLFVGNLPFSISDQDLTEKFREFGPIYEVRLARRDDGLLKGYAHIQFTDKADAIEAMKSIEEEPIFMSDRHLRVSFALNRGGRRNERDREREPSHSLYFQGFRGERDEFRDVLGQWLNSITRVNFLTDKSTGQDSGAGFIHFVDVDSATKAMNELSGFKLSEHDTLFVRYATPRRER